jgi:hypothetical protein
VPTAGPRFKRPRGSRRNGALERPPERESNSTQAWPEEAEKPWSEYEKGAMACQARPVRARLKGYVKGYGEVPLRRQRPAHADAPVRPSTRRAPMSSGPPDPAPCSLGDRADRDGRSHVDLALGGRCPDSPPVPREIPPAGRRLLRLGDLTLWCVLENRKGRQALGGSNPSPSAKSPCSKRAFWQHGVWCVYVVLVV